LRAHQGHGRAKSTTRSTAICSERCGDVQAFLLNTAVHDRANWRQPGPANPLIEAIDGYMAA